MALNLKDLGAVGDGRTQNHSGFYLPAGDYRVSATLDCKAKGVRLIGDSQGLPGNAYNGGSRISGSVAGPLWRIAYPSAGASMADLAISNLHPTGLGIEVGGVNVAIERMAICAFKGILSPDGTFTCGIRNVIVHCTLPGNPVGSVGIQLNNHTSLHAGDIVGFDHGVRVSGVGNDLRNLRIEVNRVGLILGMNTAGAVWHTNGTSVQSLALEANDIGIIVRAINTTQVGGILIQGTANAPSGGSVIGMVIEIAKESAFTAISATGGYKDVAIRVSPGDLRFSFKHIHAQNALGRAWDLPSTLHHASFP